MADYTIVNDGTLSRTRVAQFFKGMRDAERENDVEKAIERNVVNLLEDYFSKKYWKDRGVSVVVSYPHNTDGLVSVSFPRALVMKDERENNFSVLVEAKRDMTFSGREGVSDRAKVLAQVVYYLKTFRNNGDTVPTVTVIADNDEIFAVPNKFLTKYLDRTFDSDPQWKLAPSSASNNFELYSELMADKNLNLYVEKIDQQTFILNEFCDLLFTLASKTDAEKVKVNKETLTKAFNNFNDLAFSGYKTVDKKKSAQQMSVFIQSLVGSPNIYLHPNKPNTLNIEFTDHKGRTKVESLTAQDGFNSYGYELFFTKYDRSLSNLEEIKEITEIADELLEETKRRFTGDYWTPKIWVDEAHRLIERQLNTYDENGELVGEDWKERFTVWDASAGSKNLTRDYRFARLYSSTLHQDELNIADQYNPEGTAFQYDFLNDDIDLHAIGSGNFAQAFHSDVLGVGRKVSDLTEVEKHAFLQEQQGKWKLPDSLIEDLVFNRPIVFFMNPPYGQATGVGAKTKGMSETKVANIMRRENLGAATSELYTQFIYRVQLLARTFCYEKDFHLFFYNPKTFLTSPKFHVFTKQFLDDYKMRDGFMFNAGEFNGTDASWSIIFTHWSLSQEKEKTKSFHFKILDSFIQNGVMGIKKIDEWTGEQTSKSDVISRLISEPYGKKISFYPVTNNGYGSGNSRVACRMFDESIGYMHNNGDNINYSEKFTGYYTMGFQSGNGAPVDKRNFEETAVVFSIRKSSFEIEKEKGLLWATRDNVFPKPTDYFQQSEAWKEFENDCIVYSLFAHGSRQTSLRDYEYGEEENGNIKKWRINNEFFWMSRDTIRDLAVQNNNLTIQRDLDTDSDRYVHTLLTGLELSGESRRLLDVANEIVERSFKYRNVYALEQPKYQLDTWDAGWNQVYRMCFSNDALPHAKNDEKLQELYSEFKTARRTLGDKIAHKYSEDTGF